MKFSLHSTLFQLVVSFIFLLIGVSSAASSCIIPGTENTCDELLSSLPWQFNIEKEEGDAVHISFLSLEEVQQSGVRLKISLNVKNFESQEIASKTFSSVCKEADPDMGLTYAWDLVMVQGMRYYHLHADCILAEQHFHSISQALMRIIGKDDKAQQKSLLCRCGGGCRKYEE